jgi:ATP-dependent Lon protease
MKQSYPVLPLRDIVVFPHMIVPLFVGRDKSVAALEAAMADDKEIFLVAQLDPAEDDPGREDLYDTGVSAEVLQLLKLPDGTVRVLVAGKERGTLDTVDESGAFLTATVKPVEENNPEEASAELQALMRSVVDQFENYAKLNRKLPAETAVQLAELDDGSRLADAVAANIAVKVADKQSLLVEKDPQKRLEMVFAFMEGELGVLQVEKKIRSRVKRQMEKTQREYYLNEQLKAIQRELGNEGDEGDGDEIAELTQKIATLKLSKEARTKATSELKKLKTMAPMSAEATVVRNYLDVLLGLPWGKKSKLKKDIAEAQGVLDEDHYALEKVKDRIVEYLAVQARTNKLKGPILCLVGPPGVGKTSLGKSIAKATGREFIRQSLGGVRDEAEIRGHRRTYIGSLPGKIVTNLRKAGRATRCSCSTRSTSSARISAAIPRGAARGAGSGAEQQVQRPLSGDRHRSLGRDVRVHGELAQPAAAAARPHGDHPARRLYRGREARDRRAAPDREADRGARAEGRRVHPHLRGAARADPEVHARGGRPHARARDRQAGAQGAAQDPRGQGDQRHDHAGEPPRICRGAEVSPRAGRGGAPDRCGHRARLDRGRRRAADDRERDRAGQGRDQDDRQARRRDEGIGRGGVQLRQGARPSYGIKPSLFARKDVHVHLPEGAVPKDGPSAGIGLVTAIVSTMTGVPVRRDIAMTGEVTLRGRVLPIGGLKEKLLAALRGGIKTVLIPGENEKDLAEIPANIREGLEIIPVSHVDEVLRLALTEPLTAIDWTDADELAAQPPAHVPGIGDAVHH